jgi:hypothetical protein
VYVRSNSSTTGCPLASLEGTRLSMACAIPDLAASAGRKITNSSPHSLAKPTLEMCRPDSSGIGRVETYTSSRLAVMNGPHLGSPLSRNIFVKSLDSEQVWYQFQICGYVVMPEHVHLLVSEPLDAPLSKAIQALKQSVSRRIPAHRANPSP